jgi:hypothetical protein
MPAPKKTETAEALRQSWVSGTGSKATRVEGHEFFISYRGKSFQVLIRIPRNAKNIQFPDIQLPSQGSGQEEDQAPPMKGLSADLCSSCQEPFTSETPKFYLTPPGEEASRQVICGLCFDMVSA